MAHLCTSACPCQTHARLTHSLAEELGMPLAMCIPRTVTCRAHQAYSFLQCGRGFLEYDCEKGHSCSNTHSPPIACTSGSSSVNSFSRSTVKIRDTLHKLLPDLVVLEASAKGFAKVDRD